MSVNSSSKVLPKAVIVGPAEEDISGIGPRYFVPRILFPVTYNGPATYMQGCHGLNEVQAKEKLDELAQHFLNRGYRVIRCDSMEQRNAILTFVRQSIQIGMQEAVMSLNVFANEGSHDTVHTPFIHERENG